MQARTGWQETTIAAGQQDSLAVSTATVGMRGKQTRYIGREHLSGFIVASVVLIHEIGPGLDNTVVSI